MMLPIRPTTQFKKELKKAKKQMKVVFINGKLENPVFRKRVNNS